MSAFAWYYIDHSSDTIYWCYSNEMSTTNFASTVSAMIGKRISPSDTSYADGTKDLERHQGWARNVVHV